MFQKSLKSALNRLCIKLGFHRNKIALVDMIAVYIILTHYGTYYTGMTNSLIRRWHEHVSGQSSYLRRVKPKEVVYVELWPTYSMAGKREKMIKRIGARKFLIKLQYQK